ncbi:hypothetical protein E4U23_006236 [Claviceps purpurea]|nr:hypothetical protein E4U23_006236 [Claviceps purpurea]
MARQGMYALTVTNQLNLRRTAKLRILAKLDGLNLALGHLVEVATPFLLHTNLTNLLSISQSQIRESSWIYTMHSYITLLWLGLGIHAAPAKSKRHASPAIHLKRLDRRHHEAHAHAHAPAASAHMCTKGESKGDSVARNFGCERPRRRHSECRPEWVR